MKARRVLKSRGRRPRTRWLAAKQEDSGNVRDLLAWTQGDLIVRQRRESAIMVEAPFMNLLRIEKRAQRFCAVTIIRGSLRLEIINPDFLSGVQIPTRQEKSVAA